MSNTLSSPSSRLATLLATSVLSLAAAHAGAATVAYVSNADSQDIYVLRLNRDGSVNLIDKVDTGSTVMPLALSPDHKFLYAALRGQPYSVVSYAIDPASGKLKALSKVPLADNMANIATDRSGHYLLAASYSGNRISVNAIGTDGTVQAPPLAVIPTGKNAHSCQVSPDNAFVFGSTWGRDVILQYVFEPGHRHGHAQQSAVGRHQGWCRTAPFRVLAGPAFRLFDQRAGRHCQHLRLRSPVRHPDPAGQRLGLAGRLQDQ